MAEAAHRVNLNPVYPAFAVRYALRANPHPSFGLLDQALFAITAFSISRSIFGSAIRVLAHTRTAMCGSKGAGQVRVVLGPD
jgi:hypothetical protein